MGTRSEALELARFLAFDGQDADQISSVLQLQFGMAEREATQMALNVVAPAPEESPAGPQSVDVGSLFPPF